VEGEILCANSLFVIARNVAQPREEPRIDLQISSCCQRSPSMVGRTVDDALDYFHDPFEFLVCIDESARPGVMLAPSPLQE
jgi:hypothetical protein